MSASNDSEWLEGQREKLQRAKAALELDITFWEIVEGPDPMDELARYRIVNACGDTCSPGGETGNDTIGAVEQEKAPPDDLLAEADRMLLSVADHLNKPPHEIAPDRFVEDSWWRVKRQVRIAGRWVRESLDLLNLDPPIDSGL